MARLLIHVEGETEETFVNEVLKSHLIHRGIKSVAVRLLGNARMRDKRGGIQGWPPSKKDILRHLRGDPNLICSTMVDYYALPATGQKGWPGREKAGLLPFSDKAKTVESAVRDDVCAELGENFDPVRIIPYVMMHEFEGMLFSDCQRFGEGIGRTDLISKFQEIRDAFETPEAINDSVETAPSKRVTKLYPGYQKPLLGTLAALEIGLEAIRNECPHFANWLRSLESLAG